MRKYEIMYIIKPSLDQEATRNEVAKLSKILTDNGSSISKTDEWGLRDLAYPIRKETKGYYVVLQLETEENGKALKEFDRIVKLDTNVLRFLITRAHEGASTRPSTPAPAPSRRESDR